MTGVASLRPSMTCESTITAFSWLRFRVRADEKNRPPTRFWLAVWHEKDTGIKIGVRMCHHAHQHMNADSQVPSSTSSEQGPTYISRHHVLSCWQMMNNFLSLGLCSLSGSTFSHFSFFFFFVGLSPVSWPSGLAPRSWCERTGRYRGTNCSRASSASCTI